MKLIVHRGTNIECRENSICGIEEIRSITKDATIEVDIIPTKDNKLVLFHDFSLARFFNIDRLIFDFTFEELNTMQSNFTFVEFGTILKLFPSQKFLLDIRCNYHEDFFPDSKIDTNLIKEDLFEKYKSSLLKLNLENTIVSCSELTMAKKLKKELKLEVELSENYMRDYLEKIERTSSLAFLDYDIKKVNIQNKFLTHKLVEVFHKNNVEVFSTPSMSRNIQNSKTMLEKAKKFNCDGIWLSPINEDIIKAINE